MGVVVDTSAIIDVERAGLPLEEALREVASEQVVIPAIVLAELLVGVQLASTPAAAARRRAKIDALCGRAPVVPFEHVTAEHWAELFADLDRRGEPIPANDLAVAATAVSLEFDVLVGKLGEAHFRRVRSLGVRQVAVRPE